MVQLNFDASQVQPSTGTPDPIPVTAWYPCAIVESGSKPTKDNRGSYLELELEVLDGQFKGRKAWDRLNLQNNSAQAVEIAYKTLSAICHATGVIQCADSSQLHGRPMAVKISYRPAGEREGTHYEASNEIKGYKPISELNASGGAAAPASAPFTPPPVAAPPAYAAPAGFGGAQFTAAPAPVAAAAPWQQQPQPQAQQAYAPPPSAPAPTQAGTPPWQAATAPAAAPAAWTPPPAASGPQPPWAVPQQ